MLNPSIRRSGAVFAAAGVAAALVLAAAAPAAAAPAPLRYDIEPGSPVLISEIANGGQRDGDTQASRLSARNFIEITNYGDAPVDITGYRIYRCGGTGASYGPQAIAAEGTVLQPGEQYTTAGEGSGYDVDNIHSTNLAGYNYGAILEDASGQRVDAIGFYHEDVNNDCDVEGEWLQDALQHRLDESHQRVSNTGDIEADWIIAPRTVGEPNATEQDVPRIDNGLRISEFTNGGDTSTWDQYVEVTNYGDDTVDMTGYQLFRCGENGTQYLQLGALPEGTTLDPGESYLAARANGAHADEADITYGTAMHWRDSGAMLLTAEDEIIDRVGVYNNKNSACNDGRPIHEKLNHFDNTTHQRISDTGDNLTDFIQTATRTPGVEDPSTEYEPVPEWGGFRDVRISEITAAGPAGGSDEFFELGNYGDQPVDLSGWSAYRCFGTGQPGVGESVQIADLDATIEPGQTYLGVSAGAPAALQEIADGVYETGLNHTDGYGLYLTDENNQLVDAFASYDVIVDQYTPCRLGEEARNWTKTDEGESYTRAQATGDNELDFVVTAERTPGELIDAEIVDPTEPLPGELDPVEVDTNHMPGTPVTTDTGDATGITTSDQSGSTLEVTARVADLRETSDAVVREGVSPVPVPETLEIDGEQIVAEPGEVTASGTGYPFQRFEIAATEDAEFVWHGTATARNELQLLIWSDGAWQGADTAVPSADGDLTLATDVPPSAISEGTAHLLVIDGPRTDGGLIEEIGVHDNAFADPGSYDVAINHMPDTQFLAEGFRDVFRQQATWVIANAAARNIGYSTLTGDIVENWMNGNHPQERADREFQAAQNIIGLLNDADVPNGVLPGNHDNFWGRDNTLYNEYFGPSMFEEESWYGQAWAPGDNSAHTDYFSEGDVDFLVISLPYRPSNEQLAWASEQAAAHPEHSVVVSTHSYLHTSGVRDNVDLRHPATGEAVWETIVAPNDNVFLVLGGHYHGVSTQYGDPVTGEQTDATEVTPGTVAVENVGASGRMVVEMLADYQGYRSTQAEDPTVTRDDWLDRDTGFQRLLQLDLDAGLMAVNAYSPTLDTFESWRYDEPAYRGDDARYDASDEEFVVEVDLVRSTTLQPAMWAVTGPAEEIDGGTVAPGESAQVQLPTATDVDRLWYARVDDADGNTVTSVPAVLPAASTPTDPPTDDPDEEPTDGGGEPGDGSDSAEDGSGAGSAGDPDADNPEAGAGSDDGSGLPVTGATVLGLAVVALLLLAAGLLLRRRVAAARAQA